MVPILHPLPEDLTGAAETNVVRNEEHSVFDQSDQPYKVVVMEKGYFYTHDLIVMDHLRKPLIPNVDYQCIAIQPEIAKKTAFTACAVIVISNPRITQKVFVTARMVGGQYCMLTDGIIRMAETLLLGGERKVFWKNLKDKPNTFKPNGHNHLYWQLYKFTKPTATVKRMVAAQQVIAAKDFKGLYDEWQIKFKQFDDALTESEARLTTHINDKLNPHNVTKLQVQLNLVYNGSVATADEARRNTGSVMDAYATPLRTKEQIAFAFDPLLNQHMLDYNNPHGVTYQTLGVYSPQDIVSLANKYYDKGTTVRSTLKLGGLTWDQIKANIRTNNDCAQITWGAFPWQNYSNNAPSGNTALFGSPNGYTQYRAITPVLNQYVKKGNQVYYITGNLPYNYAQVQTMFQQTFGAKPDNSIGVCRTTYNHGTSTGNGGILVLLPSIFFLRCIGGVWTSN